MKQNKNNGAWAIPSIPSIPVNGSPTRTPYEACVQTSTRERAGRRSWVVGRISWIVGRISLSCWTAFSLGLYANFLTGKVRDVMADAKWFPSGIPLVFLAMHNTKEVIDSNDVILL